MPDRVRWNIKGGRVLGPAPFFVAGIVNVTPDSFYDGGRLADAQAGVDHSLELIRQGAAVLDIGGESTRPYADSVTAQQEQDRVLPLIRTLAQVIERNKWDTAISIDTYKSETARTALEEGASIVNDVSACRFDPALLDVVGQYKPGYVLMHSLAKPGRMQDAPAYDDVVDDIRAFFVKHLRRLTGAGVPEANIVLDPGIGFGKTLAHNLEILRRIDSFMDLGLPIYMGLSNKSMWEKLLGLPKDQRKNATQAATAVLAARGVHIHRVHEVAPTVETLKVAQALRAYPDGE